MKRAVAAAILLAVCLAISRAVSAGAVPSPSEFLGIEVGADRTLADYRQIVSYLKAVAAASPRVRLEVLGKTTLGEELVVAIVSSETNLKALPAIRETARKLADPRGLAEAEVAGLVREGKAVVMVTANIHSTEIGASQMAMEWIHALATATDAATLERLSNVVLLVVPSANPDGQIMETEWYRKWLGTKYEGGRMPWLYHPYVGHDNNRDWFMLTQKETKALNRAVVREWHPQVWLDEHQMGSTGPRIFTPPYASPIDPGIHPLVWREINLLGSEMSLRLEQAGKPGVIFGYTFDAYCPGMTESTAWYKNISGLLTEVASARLATPLRIEPGELTGGGTGLVDYGPQANFPRPWGGGLWRLRDIMDYERIVSDAFLEACSTHREDLLRDMAARARAAVAAAAPGEAFVIPAAQHDPASARRLAALMAEHGVEVRQAPGGDVFIPLAQPYGLFVKSLLSPERYPEVKLVPGKEIIRPYDVTAWTLPMMMGVEVRKGTLPIGLPLFESGRPAPTATGPVALPPGSPENARVVNAAIRGGGVAVATRAITFDEKDWPAGTFFFDEAASRAAGSAAAESGVSLSPLSKSPVGAAPGVVRLPAPRVGLYKPWTASTDEGWTRWILEQYGFAPTSLDNKAIRRGKLRESFDVVVLPDLTPERISTGKPKREEGEMTYFAELPPEYQGGLGKEGARALVQFVEAGGTLVALADSSDWVIAEFNVPVRNVLAKVKKEDFFCPGSLLEARVEQEHPVSWGLPKEMPIFVDGPVAFETVPPGQELRRWDLASYPDAARDVLLSGWIHGADRLTRRSAAVAMTYGKGKLVLLGFRPQFRAWTSATFPFLFNALWWSVEDGPLSGSTAAP